jgi:cysteinyl-tRNA synthetase
MALRLYNTLTRKKEEFEPIVKGTVGLYCCGPTVYWYQHIGNLRTFISEDILKRVLLMNGYEVKHVVNVTDVGHLTSDADEGEDKLMKAIKREKLPLVPESMLKIADKYLKEFQLDFQRLNILSPDVWCKATEHVPEMLDLNKSIEKNGFTYKTSVGLIFDTSKYPDYTKLANIKIDNLEQGARVKKDPERRNKTDFALWITNQPNHIMLWDSPWGKGFPGWHIECSAMSMKYLGEQFDIHCGGQEHIPVHHTNEIAQSEAATGKKPWVKYWVHMEWLVVPSGKMSKSKGSFTTVADLIEKGYDPLVFRYFCLGAHYKQQLTFSFEALDGAVNTFKRLKEKVLELKEKGEESESCTRCDDYRAKFKEAVNDDLNTPQALAVLWSVLRDDIPDGCKLKLALEFDAVLGLGMDEWEREKVDAPQEVLDMLAEREEARKSKDWERSDELRDKIKEKGFAVDDTPDGAKLKKL